MPQFEFERLHRLPYNEFDHDLEFQETMNISTPISDEIYYMKKEKAKEEPQVITRESGLVEWVCKHGVGHPTLESAIRVAKEHGDEPEVWMIHGCCPDQCCQKKFATQRLRKTSRRFHGQ
jgi:hypothetical protein